MSALMAVLCLAMSLAPQSAHATPPSDADEARRLFESALAAFDRGEYATARDHFRRSLALEPRPFTAGNLAMLLRAMGENLEAEALLGELLSGRYGELDAPYEREVRELQRDVSSEVATLHVRQHGADSATVRIDGAEVATLRPDELRELRVNAGRHTIVAVTEDRRIVERVVELPRGGRADVPILFPSASASASSRAAGPLDDLEGSTDDGGGSWTSSPWFWVALGAVVIGGLAAVVLTLVDFEQDPVSHEIWGRRMALSGGHDAPSD
jgi:hypothetical protein